LNYLGHIFLSGLNEPLLVGNFIGDYVKGRQFENYPSEIKQGIILHRAIDEFTDHHPAWMTIRELIRPVYNRHAGVVADLFIDHYLAKNWDHYSQIRLQWYAKWVYAVFLKHYEVLPDRVKGFLPFMIQHRRLQSYAEHSGIEISLRIMALHTSLPDHTDKAMLLLKNHDEELAGLSNCFLPEVQLYVTAYLRSIQQTPLV
jgi:acyl carrier protein phosphodiesterase